MSITFAVSKEEIRAVYPLMKQLRPHLQEEEFVSQVIAMQAGSGYQLAVLYAEGEAKAAAGYRVQHNLAWGQYLYVDDLITDQESRSKGYAATLFSWLEEQARNEGCEVLHLDSGVQRHDAHRFYMKRGMRISGYHFDLPIR